MSSSSIRNEYEQSFRYGVACLPFYGGLGITAGVLALLMSCVVRRQHDPARSYINWLRAAFVMFVL